MRVGALNCSEPYACEDLGRRRRRLLSIGEQGDDQGLQKEERAIERQAEALQSAAETAKAKGAAKAGSAPRRHPRAAARAAARSREAGGMWQWLLKTAKAQVSGAARTGKNRAPASLAAQVVAEVSSQMDQATGGRKSEAQLMERVGQAARRRGRVRAKLEKAEEKRAALAAAQRRKEHTLAALRAAVARERDTAARLQAAAAAAAGQAREATEVELKIYVARAADLAGVRGAVLAAILDGDVSAQLEKVGLDTGPVGLSVGLWRSIRGFSGVCVCDLYFSVCVCVCVCVCVIHIQ